MPLFTEEQLTQLPWWVGTASAVSALGGFGYGLWLDLSKRPDPKHDVLEYLQRSGAAAGLPPAIVLTYGAFDPSVIPHLASLKWPIAVAGVLFLYTSIRGLLR